jgi:hypothetical protein
MRTVFNTTARIARHFVQQVSGQTMGFPKEIAGATGGSASPTQTLSRVMQPGFPSHAGNPIILQDPLCSLTNAPVKPMEMAPLLRVHFCGAQHGCVDSNAHSYLAQM